MKSNLSRRALLLGSATSGLIAGAIGPLALIVGALATNEPLNAPPATSFTLEGLGLLLLAAVVFGIIGVVAAVLVGFPILSALQRSDRLTNISALLTGAMVGLGVALLLWLLDSFKPRIFPTAGLVGASCGWIALRIAKRVPMRPNISLERTREG